MAINKSFVIKNGVQVSTDLIIGDADNNKVGIGTTIPGYELHVGRGRKSRGGIGATDLVVTGVATVTNLNVTGLSTFAGAVDVNGTVDFSQDVVFNGTNDITYDQSESALVFNDGAAIRVGTSSDFSISHDGNNTILRENGTGDVKLLSSRIQLGHTRNAGVGDTAAVFTEGGASELWFNSNKKFETVAIGATIFGDFIVAGVTTTQKLNVTGVATVGGALSLPDNTKAQFGTGGDLLIYHDSSNSYIDDQGTGDLIIRGSADIKLQSASGENYIIANDTGSVEQYFDNSKKTETTSGGFKVTGITTLTNRLHVQAGVSTFDADVRFGIGATVGFGTSAFFKDDAAIWLGDDSDLEVVHTNDISKVKAADLRFQTPSDEEYIICTENAGVSVYYDNSKKLESTSGGLNVTGITTFSDRINVVSGVSTFQDNAKLTFGTQADLSIFHNGSNSIIRDSGTGNLFIDSNRLEIRNSGGGETQAVFIQDGAVELYHDNAKKAETTSGGLNVTGITTISDRLQVTSGISTFYDTTQSTSATTGAVVLDGGLGVAKNVNIGGNLTVTGTTTLNGGTVTLGDANTDNVVFSADVDSSITPDDDDTYDLGSATKEWRDLHLDGIAHLDNVEAGIGTFSSNLLVSGISTFTGNVKVTNGSDVTLAASIGAGSSTILFDSSAGSVIFQDNIRAKFGTGSDLSIYHDGSNSFIQDSGTGDILISGDANVSIVNAAASEFKAKFITDGAVELYHNNVKAVETTADGILVGTGVTIQKNGGVSIAGITTLGGQANAVGGVFCSTDGVANGVKIGAGEDLIIQHNGTNSFIDNNTGDLYIQTTGSGDDILIEAADNVSIKVHGSEDGINITGDGSVQLYHDNSERLVTTTDGVDIGGTGSIRVPNGTTGQRNSSPQAGDFRYNTTDGKFEGYTDSWGEIGGSGGVSETDTSVSTTSATSCGSFAKASFRSAAIIAQITQGSAYQVGRYLLIHDGTTVTTVEESAVATGSMLGTFEGVINGSNVEFRVTMGSSSSATVTTKIDTVTV